MAGGQQNGSPLLGTREISLITDALVSAVEQKLSGKDFHSDLINLVKEVVAVNTQVVSNQEQIKDIIKKEVVPLLESYECPNTAKCAKSCGLVDRMEENGVVDLLKTFKDENYAKRMSKIVKEVEDIKILNFLKKAKVVVWFMIVLIPVVAALKALGFFSFLVKVLTGGQ